MTFKNLELNVLKIYEDKNHPGFNKALKETCNFLEEKLEALKEALEQFDTPKEGNDGESRPTE